MPATGKTFPSSLFSSFDSSRNLDLVWYRGVPHAGLDAREEKRLRPESKKLAKTRSSRKLTNREKMVVLYGTSVVKESVMATASMSKRRREGGDEAAVRERILEAAFAAFMKSGYATASTLEIATRARVSKRELYALVL